MRKEAGEAIDKQKSGDKLKASLETMSKKKPETIVSYHLRRRMKRFAFMAEKPKPSSGYESDPYEEEEAKAEVAISSKKSPVVAAKNGSTAVTKKQQESSGLSGSSDYDSSRSDEGNLLAITRRNVQKAVAFRGKKVSYHAWKAVASQGKKFQKHESSDSSSVSESEDEEAKAEVPISCKKSPAVAAKNGSTAIPKKKQESSVSSGSSDSDSSSSDEENMLAIACHNLQKTVAFHGKKVPPFVESCCLRREKVAEQTRIDFPVDPFDISLLLESQDTVMGESGKDDSENDSSDYGSDESYREAQVKKPNINTVKDMRSEEDESDSSEESSVVVLWKKQPEKPAAAAAKKNSNSDEESSEESEDQQHSESPKKKMKMIMMCDILLSAFNNQNGVHKAMNFIGMF
ncbi:hypothetical protein ACLOJK_021498 [Asimina triloba]